MSKTSSTPNAPQSRRPSGKEPAFLSSTAARPGAILSPTPNPLPLPGPKAGSKLEAEQGRGASSKPKQTSSSDNRAPSPISTSLKVPGAYRDAPKMEEERLPPDKERTDKGRDDSSSSGSSPVLVDSLWGNPFQTGQSTTPSNTNAAGEDSTPLNYGQAFHYSSYAKPPSRPPSALSQGSQSTTSSASSRSGLMSGRIMRGKVDFPPHLRDREFVKGFRLYLRGQDAMPSVRNQIKGLRSMELQSAQIVKMNQGDDLRPSYRYALAAEELKRVLEMVEGCNQLSLALAELAGRKDKPQLVDKWQEIRGTLQYSKSEIHLRSMFNELQEQFAVVAVEVRRSVAHFIGESEEADEREELEHDEGRARPEVEERKERDSEEADEATVAASLAPEKSPPLQTAVSMPPHAERLRNKSVQFREVERSLDGSAADAVAESISQANWLRSTAPFDSVSGSGFQTRDSTSRPASPLLHAGLFRSEYQPGMAVAMTGVADQERFIRASLAQIADTGRVAAAGGAPPGGEPGGDPDDDGSDPRADHANQPRRGQGTGWPRGGGLPRHNPNANPGTPRGGAPGGGPPGGGPPGGGPPGGNYARGLEPEGSSPRGPNAFQRGATNFYVAYPGGPPGGGPPGGGNPYTNGNGGHPRAQGYYQIAEPRLEDKFKIKDLPSWDGNRDTALRYLLRVEEMASISPSIARDMGRYLWLQFDKGSEAESWYSALPERYKDAMRTDYKSFLRGVCASLLGPDWYNKERIKYGEMHFRQKGKADETPIAYTRRRILTARMLGIGQQEGVPASPIQEVDEVIRGYPVSWSLRLKGIHVQNLAELQQLVQTLSEELVHAYEAELGASRVGRHRITAEDILPLLDRLEVPYKKGKMTPHSQHANRRNAMLSEKDAGLDQDDSDEQSGEDPLFAEAFAVIRQRQRPPPPGGYLYNKRDDVVTKLARKPPSPCRACGSSKHWDRECPFNELWLKAKREKEVHALATERPEEQETVYDRAYETVTMQTRAFSYIDVNGRTEESSVPPVVADPKRDVEGDGQVSRRPKEVHTVERPRMKDPRAAFVEEVEDEESNFIPAQRDTMATEVDHSNPEVLEIPPRRRFKPGRSHEGVSVSSVKGHINAMDEPLMDLRLDSGADVTLLSSSTYASLKSPPKLRKGSKLELFQLVDKSETIEGYVYINLYVPALDGRVLKLKAEAYVVPNMSVPILLGEDFHRTYEIVNARSLKQGNRIAIAGQEPFVAAQDVSPIIRRPRIIPNPAAEASFVRTKSSRRLRAQRRKTRAVQERALREVRLKEDLRISPSSVANAKIQFLGESDGEIYLEKGLIRVEDNTFAAIPNCLLASSDGTVPIANTAEREIFLAKGTLLGEARRPSDFFDRPRDLRHLEKMLNAAARVAAVAQVMDSTKTSGEEGGRPNSNERAAFMAKGDPRASTRPFPQDESEEGPWGPKTAEVTDPTIYKASRMKDIIDVGSLPSHLEDEAWAMLERRKNAFGFDGKLGHLATKVHIRTVDGLQPIAVPMYGSSPEKRLVIEEQLKKWFDQDVIEASRSPWSAPVVIAYRNGKPRFCVDYRKLNEHTVADEFPIPRQSEILAALSGAQVLSSLDALAGFTQMELDESEKEKTAFRTHLGLFQFKRMPFGLRNGPSIFQRTMQTILAPFLWLFCLVYIDDIVVYSKTYEEHIQHLERVLAACEDAGLTLSPAKCHLFYPSVLLLGHKVSRLGLSTHAEKVKAIMELSRPAKIAHLQTFLGMAGYFSAFIPYYSMMAAPLFAMLKKGTKWRWGPEEDHAFEAIKKALQEAPVLGHPEMGSPYRLYTDASDEAIGCALQQVQSIRAEDLRGTKYLERLEKARTEGKPVPKLVTTLPAAPDDTRFVDEWGETVAATNVHVERVIGYWSRTLKPAERNYSATEREALAAKEGLIKFQPFIEGEKVALVTDHAALQWARTYENANRRLAAWGAVFSAYKPGLTICHRPGRVHSNVDPLSRLPRDRETGEVRGAPEHQSPSADETIPIRPDNSVAAKYESDMESKPREIFWSEEDEFERPLKSVFAVTRAQAKRAKGWRESEQTPRSERKKKKRMTKKQKELEALKELEAKAEAENKGEVDVGKEEDLYERKVRWQAENKPPRGHLLVHLREDKAKQFRDGYADDIDLGARWREAEKDDSSWYPGQRFFRDSDGLLYFRDADYQPRLCVPKSVRNEVLREFHESPFEGAHAGFDRMWGKMATIFYWKGMRKDVRRYCETCDVCQKTKARHSTKLGKLQPNPIPSRLFETVSMDLIVGLPMSNGFNAIWVVVDRLSKFALFVPTTTGLSAEGFAEIFVKHLACRFGIPENIITDRDPRWTHDFWRAVARFLKTDMWLSSSHHPQHDGQTERMNRQLEVMLRAYVSEDKKDWAEWLPLLEHAYNSATAGSTGYSPFFLLYGFQPRDAIAGKRFEEEVLRDPTLVKAEEFLRKLESHRADARDSIARAQDAQAKNFNKGRKEVDLEPGALVLVDPHALEWIESKGEGAKLSPKFLGPFAIQERVGANTYRLDLPDSFPGSPVINLEHLKVYKASPEDYGERSSLDPYAKRKEASEEYQVEKVVGHRFDRRKGAIEFLVRWEGQSPLYDSWLSAKDLRNAPRRLYEYRQKAGV